MGKIQINKGDLLRIVESTVRAIINENGANLFINEGYGRENMVTCQKPTNQVKSETL